VVFSEIVAENKLWVITITEEIALCNWFDFVVVEFESIFIGKRHYTIFQASNRFKKLI